MGDANHRLCDVDGTVGSLCFRCRTLCAGRIGGRHRLQECALHLVRPGRFNDGVARTNFCASRRRGGHVPYWRRQSHHR
jgi:hypothetical protein